MQHRIQVGTPWRLIKILEERRTIRFEMECSAIGTGKRSRGKTVASDHSIKDFFYKIIQVPQIVPHSFLNEISVISKCRRKFNIFVNRNAIGFPIKLRQPARNNQ